MRGTPAVMNTETTPGTAQRPNRPERAPSCRPWAELLARTFAVDVLDCPKCHGRMSPGGPQGERYTSPPDPGWERLYCLIWRHKSCLNLETIWRHKSDIFKLCILC